MKPNPSPTLTGGLSRQQVDAFHEEGYLILDSVFDPGDLQPLRQEIGERIDRKIHELLRAGRLKNDYANEPFERRATRVYQESRECGEAIIKDLMGKAGGGYCGPEMFKMLSHPKLLAVLECLVGPEIIASSVFRIRPKIPGFGRGVVPWHQDSGYFAQQCDKHLIVTCWLPLVDANEANGCMKILPRAHRNGICTHHTGGQGGYLVIEDQDLPASSEQVITAEVPLGGVVLMSNLTPHCSTPNRSDVIRWSIDLRYQGAGAPTNAGLWPNIEDDDQPQGVLMACYPPEADFVVQSRKNPAAVSDYADFVRRRETYDKAKGLPYAELVRGWMPLAKQGAA